MTQLEGNKAKLVVRDHGIGICKEDQAKIFERFERVASVYDVSRPHMVI
jgi:signal transduction histidine kinase